MRTHVLTALLLLSLASGARSEDGHHTFWIAKGLHNRVYLLGSVHVLKPTDSDLPPEALHAYVHLFVPELGANAKGSLPSVGAA